MNWRREKGISIKFWEERIRVLASSQRTLLKTRKIRRNVKIRKGKRNQRGWRKNVRNNETDLKRMRRERKSSINLTRKGKGIAQICVVTIAYNQ